MSEFSVTPSQSTSPEKAADNVLVPRGSGEISVGRLTDRYDQHGRRIVSVYDEAEGGYSKEKPLARATLSGKRQQELADELAADLELMRGQADETLPRRLGGAAIDNRQSLAGAGTETGTPKNDTEAVKGPERQRLIHAIDHLNRRANYVHYDNLEQGGSSHLKYVQLDGAARQVVEDVVRTKEQRSLAESTEILGIAVGMMTQGTERGPLYTLLEDNLNVDMGELSELFMRTDNEQSRLDDRGIKAQIEVLEAWRQKLEEEGRHGEPIASLVGAARLGSALRVSDGSARSKLVSDLSQDLINKL